MKIFKLASILSICSRPGSAALEGDICKKLAEGKIAAPTNAISDDNISYLELRRIFFMFADRDVNCPIRNIWRDSLLESSTDEMVALNNIKGCMASKSGLTDFEEMRDHAKSASNVQFHIKNYSDRVEELAEIVLNGTNDCSKYKDKPARIVRQEWDGKMWLANDGGSHRTAAVWHIDREQRRERLLPAKVTTNSISPEFRQQCASHSIWLFKFQSKPEKFYELCLAIKERGGVLSRQQNLVTSSLDSPDYCLVIKKDDPLHHAIAQIMTPAFNLSQWVNCAYGSNLINAQPSFLPLREATL